jgi:hypothetical protein
MKRTMSFALSLSIVLGTMFAAAAPAAGTEWVAKGCTPGYWKQTQHFGNWVAPYDPDDLFSSAFSVNAFPGMTLLEVLEQGGGGLNALGRHVVAALLNAAYFETVPGYFYNVPLWPDDTVTSPWEVVLVFGQTYNGTSAQVSALKNKLENANETGCPLGRALLPLA